VELEPLVETVRVLGGTLLHFLWQGALIGLIAAGVLRAAARRPARDRYLICLAALLACAAAPLITAGLLSDRPTGVSVAVAAAITVQATTPARQALTDWLAIDILHAVVGIWLLGVLSIATYYALLWRSVNRVRQGALPLTAPGHLIASAVRMLGQWKATRDVPLMVSELVSSPIVLGVWRPIIVFPAATIARMPVADFELILLHEMAHIIRRDTWVNTLQVLLEIVFFYHPAVHWISRRARLERECACDDFVVASSGSAYQYARALTELAGVHSHEQPALALGAANGDLLPRLRNLAGECMDGDAFPRTPLQFALVALLITTLWMHALVEQWRASHDAPPVRSTASTEVRQLARRAATAAQVATPNVYAMPALESAQSDRAMTETTAAALPKFATKPRPAPATPIPSLAEVAVDAPEMPAWVNSEAIDVDPAPASAEPVAAAPIETAMRPESVLTTTFSPPPEYPTRARMEGIEGAVSVVVRVAPDGHTRGLRVIAAQPLGVFEGAVRRALMKWRYDIPQDMPRAGDLEVSYQLSFTLSGVASTATGICATATASRTCAPR
jgi:bla regulator protein blaR1